jgi:hypothetical protein
MLLNISLELRKDEEEGRGQKGRMGDEGWGMRDGR